MMTLHIELECSEPTCDASSWRGYIGPLSRSDLARAAFLAGWDLRHGTLPDGRPGFLAWCPDHLAAARGRRLRR